MRAHLLLLPLAALACSSSTDPSTPAGSAGAAGASAGCAAGATAGTAGAPAGSGITRDGDVVTVTMERFTVEPGEEVYRCQNFANPFDGDVDVERWESEMTPGSHHMLFFYREGAVDGPSTPCSGLEFQATPFSTQLPKDGVTYPPGVAARVKKSSGFRVQSHYLNTTKTPIDAVVRVRMHLAAKPAEQRAGVLFMVQPNFSVPPNTKQTVTRKCKMPLDASVIYASSHMHRHGVAFTSSIAGTKLHETTSWADPPPTLFSPPLSFKKGDPIEFNERFGCTSRA